MSPCEILSIQASTRATVEVHLRDANGCPANVVMDLPRAAACLEQLTSAVHQAMLQNMALTERHYLLAVGWDDDFATQALAEGWGLSPVNALDPEVSFDLLPTSSGPFASREEVLEHVRARARQHWPLHVVAMQITTPKGGAIPF